MKDLDKKLEKVYNTLGNKYITDNFISEPFEFRVKIRRGDRDDDLQDYIVEVYSIPNMPKSFTYKPEKNEFLNGIHISVLKSKFKEFIKYVDSSFGGYGGTVGVNFIYEYYD
jgi:hypothetical protein